MSKQLFTTILTILICAPMVLAQSIHVEYRKGGTDEVIYRNSTASGKGIKLDNGELVRYTEIALIKTDHFEAFDKIYRKAGNKYPHLEVEFTGDQNAYSLQLEKLEKRKVGADVTRAAGGIMTILGVLSGDRGLTAAGLATNAAGQIAKEVNNDRTRSTQNAMLNDLDQRTREAEAASKNNNPPAQEAKSEEDLLREEYGDENVDGVIELIDKNYAKALAYANVGELSKDANHRVAAVWLKALIAYDQGDETAANKEYERLVVLDPELKNVKNAEEEVALLKEELDILRTE